MVTNVITLLLTASLLSGQGQAGLESAPAADAPAFEVASIKPDTSDGRGMSLNIERSGRFRGSGVPLKLILQEAYQVKDAQIVGAPSWLGSDKFVVDAKPDEATSAEMQKMDPDQRKDKLMLMLRSLLVERCKLTLRKETRDLPIYALLVGKTGPKFHESAPPPNDPASPDGKPRAFSQNLYPVTAVLKVGRDMFRFEDSEGVVDSELKGRE